MHDMTGSSMIWDRVRRVMLANSIEMQVTRERAEIVIGSSIDDREPETVVFTRPSIVTTLMLLADVLEQQGAGLEPQAEARETSWAECASCGGTGGRSDNYGTWYECGECHGAGITSA
jgi:hypothetical protein